MALQKGREMVFKEYFQRLKNHKNQNNQAMMLNIIHLVMTRINSVKN